MSERLLIPISEVNYVHVPNVIPAGTINGQAYLPPFTPMTDSNLVNSRIEAIVTKSTIAVPISIPADDEECKMMAARDLVIEQGISVAQAALDAGVSYYKLAKALRNDDVYQQKQKDLRKKRTLNREIDEGIMREIRKECQDPNLKISPTTLRKYRRIALDGIRAQQAAMVNQDGSSSNAASQQHGTY